ncbi:MAG: class I SAM-dependent methyltransferase [Magnetococcales bacterium]|nr:class I SAM-dependent methyltransferase [Magnetococcales bacterium]
MEITLSKLIGLYESKGYTISVGVNPCHRPDGCQDNLITPFANLFKNGAPVTEMGGISVQELYFLESLATVFAPKRIFIIGNAFGWSTLACALIFPFAKVVAIDTLAGIEGRALHLLTQELIRDAGLNAKVIEATSPQDVERVVREELDGEIHLALIDGLHTDEQQKKDYHALLPRMHPNSVMLFHDVINHKMLESFKEIAAHWKGHAELLMRTPSGMGICYSQALEATVGKIAHAFNDPIANQLPIPNSRSVREGRVSLPKPESVVRAPQPAAPVLPVGLTATPAPVAPAAAPRPAVVPVPPVGLTTATLNPRPAAPAVAAAPTPPANLQTTINIITQIFQAARQGTLAEPVFQATIKLLQDAGNTALVTALIDAKRQGKR